MLIFEIRVKLITARVFRSHLDKAKEISKIERQFEARRLLPSLPSSYTSPCSSV
jgi:hypothetical protein